MAGNEKVALPVRSDLNLSAEPSSVFGQVSTAIA